MDNVKTKNRLSASTIAIIVLSILLVASVAIGATLAYFTATEDVTGTITLGDPVNINITQGGAAVTSLTFSGDAMPGTVFDQAIAISVPADTSDALLRAKLTITYDDGATTLIEATTATGWTDNTSTDTYYYYDGVASAGDSIDFVTTVTVPTTLTNEDANKVFTINVVVEAIQEANYAAASVWTTAPSTWVATYATAPTD